VADLRIAAIDSLQNGALIDKTGIRVSADRTGLYGRLDLRADGGDITANLDSAVYSYWPLRSVSKLAIESENLELSALAGLAVSGMEYLRQAAQHDMLVGYSEDFLTKKMSGFLLRSNDFEGKWLCRTLTSGNASCASGLVLKYAMTGGKLDMVLDWPEKNAGTCSLGIKGDFSGEKAILKIESELDEVPIQFKKDDFQVKGLLSWDWDYSVTGYRLKHAIENRTWPRRQRCRTRSLMRAGGAGLQCIHSEIISGLSRPVLPVLSKPGASR
jgi:hypothetical protein